MFRKLSAQTTDFESREGHVWMITVYSILLKCERAYPEIDQFDVH